MNIGQRIMEGIINGQLCHAKCAHDDEHSCVIVWSSGAAEQIEALAQPESGSFHRLVRPLSPSGVADCPKCGANESVARHNADWTCHKCGFNEVVDEDREAV